MSLMPMKTQIPQPHNIETPCSMTFITSGTTKIKSMLFLHIISEITLKVSICKQIQPC